MEKGKIVEQIQPLKSLTNQNTLTRRSLLMQNPERKN